MQPPIHGIPPTICGQRLEALICQSFEVNGELEEPANAVFLKLSGGWYRLSIDAGVVFWRVEKHAPAPWDIAAEGWRYPHWNVGAEFALDGRAVTGIDVTATHSVTSVEIKFDNGQRFLLSNADDRSTYSISEPAL